MRLNYGDILAAENRITSVGRDVALTHAYPDGALEKVFFGEGTPATKVVEELELLLASTREEVVADREKIEKFLSYARHHVQLEKAKALMRKAALAVKKTGMRYDKAQLLFADALEDVGADEFDDNLNIMGWPKETPRPASGGLLED